MIRAALLGFAMLCAAATATAQTQSEPVRIERRPMRDGSGIVIGYLVSATNTTNDVQCVRARMEPELVSNGGIFRTRLVLKPRERNVAFARLMAGVHFDGVMVLLEPDENCPERGAR